MKADADVPTYSERQARAEIRAALKDIDRGRAQLVTIRKRLAELPAYQRCAAETVKEGGGDLYVTAWPWEMSATISEAMEALDEQVPRLWKDLRRTEAHIQARNERFREAETAER